jgi:hypothetical protein
MVSKAVTFGSTRIVADGSGGFVQVVVQCFHYRPGADPPTTAVVEYSHPVSDGVREFVGLLREVSWRVWPRERISAVTLPPALSIDASLISAVVTDPCPYPARHPQTQAPIEWACRNEDGAYRA